MYLVYDVDVVETHRRRGSKAGGVRSEVVMWDFAYRDA
jgi:hypothetical protein